MENQEKTKLDSNNIVLVLGITALLLVGGFFVYRFLSKPKTVDQPINLNQIQDQVDANQEIELPEGKVRRITDGVIIDEGDQVKRTYAVIIENSADAWPLSGLADARLVYEAPVEGAIPRFMALFDDTQKTKEIGPVRSARQYHIDWALGLQALFVHVGGSPNALSLVNNMHLRTLNQFFYSQFFKRDRKRPAPHNVYTSIKELKKGYENRQFQAQHLPSFQYLDSELRSSAVKSQKITIPFSPHSSKYEAVWKFDDKQNDYIRYQGKQQQFDEDRSEVRAKNVAVVYTTMVVVDDEGRLAITTEGEGRATVFVGGGEIKARWIKEDRAAPLRFISTQGMPIKFNPGSTWIEIVPDNTEVVTEKGDKI